MMKQIIEYMKHIHGHATAEAIADHFGDNPGHIQACIGLARSKGYPICSDEQGFYWSEEPEDITKTIKHLEQRLAYMRAAVDGLKRCIGE